MYLRVYRRECGGMVGGVEPVWIIAFLAVFLGICFHINSGIAAEEKAAAEKAAAEKAAAEAAKAAAAEKKKLELARLEYQTALDELARENSSDNKIKALELGRHYASLSRELHQGDKTVTLFDEVALTNDINARLNS